MKKTEITLVWVLILMVLLISSKNLTAQNIIITDEESQSADGSAMLEVYSNTKGMLVPRLTQTQMENIVNPVAGLLVYNKTSDNFFFYTGTDWLAVGVTEYFLENAGNLHTREDTVHIGIGTSTPFSKLTVQGDQPTGNNEALFEVKNSEGQAIFAVYENEVRVNFKEETDGTKSTKGGFAVGGLSPNKAGPTDYFRISPDTVQVFINDNYGVKGRKGGFAVGGLSPNGKGERMTYLSIGPDSTRVYVNDTSFSKGRKGGFAVGGLSPNKGVSDLYLTIERDSTRVYMDNSVTKGRKGGFAVGGLSPNKAGVSTFLDLTPDNYFIGHQSGINTVPGTGDLGKYNTFFGYESGKVNEDGYSNVFIGFQSGFNNEAGSNNAFVGNKAGYSNTGGSSNTFYGHECGYSNTTGSYNAFYGYQAGKYNNAGNANLFVGNQAGRDNTTGDLNTFLGNGSGQVNNADQNTFVGTHSGINTSSGGYNVFLGTMAGYTNETGSSNVFIGNQAGYKSLSHSNTYVGGNAGLWKTGGFNTFVGAQAGFGNGNTSGNNNVAIGWRAGFLLAGDNNIFIGNQAGSSETGSNKLYIENSNAGSTSALIYGDFLTNDLRFNADVGISKSPSYKLDVNGDINVSSGYDIMKNGVSIATQWTTSGANIYYNSGKVGIGTSSPQTALDIRTGGGDSFRVYSGTYSHGINIDPWPISTSAVNIDPVETGQAIYFGRDTQASKWVFQSGNVGIGTTTPDYKLQVTGDIAPETTSIYDIGSATHRWNNVYATSWSKEKATYFDYKKALSLIKSHEVSFDSNGTLNVKGMPDELTNNGFFKIGETALFNYQVNKYQQEYIEELESRIKKLETIVKTLTDK